MIKIKPQNPKGVRDYLPLENQRREYIISVIKKHYELYGFQSIYNPVFEKLETLQGKYGDEGDKLLFKILNSGEYLEKKAKFIEISSTLKLYIKSLISKIINDEISNNLSSMDLDPKINLDWFYTEVNEFAKKIRIGHFVNSRFKEDFEIQVIDYLKSALTYCYDCPDDEQLELKTIDSFSAYLAEKYFLNQESTYFLEAKYITKNISEKGLRYDHTVPLARFVSQHQNELTFPFKRYVIGSVWRADRPQRGRYQEFFQCDADIVGSKGLVSDVEMITLIDSVFKELNLKVEIKINNRKIYNGICEEIGIEEGQITPVSTILDKWDKIGEEKVKEELSQIIGEAKTQNLIDILAVNTPEELNLKLITHNSKLTEGLSELNYIFTHSRSENLKFDLKLLRGLDYYTGTVLEMVSTEMVYGSIGGGGRYDDLTELFGLKDMSGIGISFGLDRVYDVMTELKRFPENTESKKILVLNLTEAAISQYFSLLSEIRGAGKVVDLYPTIAKMDKQLTYADKAGYTFAILIGEDELGNNQAQIKNLKERRQESIDIKDLINKL